MKKIAMAAKARAFGTITGGFKSDEVHDDLVQ